METFREVLITFLKAKSPLVSYIISKAKIKRKSKLTLLGKEPKDSNYSGTSSGRYGGIWQSEQRGILVYFISLFYQQT